MSLLSTRRLRKTLSRAACCLLFVLLALAAAIGAQTPLPTDWLGINLVSIQVDDPHNFSFAVFGDNRDDQGRFDRLINAVNSDPSIAFSLDVGDLVNHPDEGLYRAFFAQVSHLKKPLLIAMGNHELGRDPAAGRRLYANIFGPSLGPFDYSFQIGQTSFIVLDDADQHGPHDAQRTWLERELKKAQSCTYRLVFLHVPLYSPPGLNHSLPRVDADRLLALLKKYRVTQIFAGHIHGYFRGHWDGIPYVITGGAGVPLQGRDPAHYFFHYVKVHVTPKALEITVHKIQP
jgi:hypothetical protein